MQRTHLFAFILVTGIATSPALAHGEDTDDLRLQVPQPHLAIGASLGRVGVDTGHEGRAVSLQGRLELGRLGLALELGKEEIEDLGRTDRRLGVSVQWHFTRGAFSPFIRAGGGVIRSESFSGGLVYDDLFGQAGAGIAVQLTPRISLRADAVWGQRERLRWVSQDVLLLTIYVPETTHYSRIGAGLVISL